MLRRGVFEMGWMDCCCCCCCWDRDSEEGDRAKAVGDCCSESEEMEDRKWFGWPCDMRGAGGIWETSVNWGVPMP